MLSYEWLIENFEDKADHYTLPTFRNIFIMIIKITMHKMLHRWFTIWMISMDFMQQAARYVIFLNHFPILHHPRQLCWPNIILGNNIRWIYIYYPTRCDWHYNSTTSKGCLKAWYIFILFTSHLIWTSWHYSPVSSSELISVI